jgi:hypothetical protein
MTTVPAKIIRGGSSKGIYLDVRDLPVPGPERDALILKVFGSPDQRQIDGLGGADKLTSKVAVMGPPTRDDCHVDYHFGQVNTQLPRVDWAANCGNLSAGAALWGALTGMCEIEGDVARVNVHQVNTGRRLVTTVPLSGGFPAVEGDFRIGGVPGTGPRIDVDFGDFAGSALGGHVLPTGNPVDRYDVAVLYKSSVVTGPALSGCFFRRRARTAPRSASHFNRIVVPQVERVSPILAVGCCGKAVAFGTEDGRGLIVDG